MRPFIVLTSVLLLPSFAIAQEIRFSADDLAAAMAKTDESAPGKWRLVDGVLTNGKVASKKPKDGEWQVLPVERFVPEQVPSRHGRRRRQEGPGVRDRRSARRRSEEGVHASAGLPVGGSD